MNLYISAAEYDIPCPKRLSLPESSAFPDGEDTVAPINGYKG